MYLDQKAPRRGGVLFKLIVVLILLGGLTFGLLATFRTGDAPVITIEARGPAIGKRTPIDVRLETTSRGLSSYKIELVQGERSVELTKGEFTPAPAWMFWSQGESKTSARVEPGKETISGLRQGEAVIRVTAFRARTWLFDLEPAVKELSIPVRLTPPTLAKVSTQVYVAQGGSEVVVYEVGDTAVSSGVRAGDWWFPGYALPGGKPNQRFALFAVPYDMGNVDRVRLIATDDVGNEASLAIVDQFTPKPFREDTISVTTPFMNKVVPEILSHSPDFEDQGELLKNYVTINSKMRKQNNQTLIELAKNSKAEFTWKKAFFPMQAKVMSSFADRRTYVFEGKEVDKQDHLGFDLASVKKAPIPSANDGVVVLAQYFGIYGNAVVVDHGFGLMSLYAHLSTIDVKVGDVVERGASLGTSGETGLAGGDHLHFTMLLHGLPTNPIEWWDAHWITDRLKRKLGPALAFEGGA